MTRRDWWLGVACIVAALILHALVPRYEWRHIDGSAWGRVDRWSGELRGTFQQTTEGIRWVPR